MVILLEYIGIAVLKDFIKLQVHNSDEKPSQCFESHLTVLKEESKEILEIKKTN